MGTEIVFVLILPVAVLCLLAGVRIWRPVAKIGWAGTHRSFKAYVPLLVGFAVSMAGLTFLTYVERSENFTFLVEQGYYTENDRSEFLPGRVFGQTIVHLTYILPAISFVVVPITTWLITSRRLTLESVSVLAISGWLALSLLAGFFNFATILSGYSLLWLLVSTAVPVLLYGLPIPLAAIWLLPARNRPENH